MFRDPQSSCRNWRQKSLHDELHTNPRANVAEIHEAIRAYGKLAGIRTANVGGACVEDKAFSYANPLFQQSKKQDAFRPPPQHQTS